MPRGERDLRVNFLSNVRDFLRGARDSGDALEDLQRSFEQVDSASDRANSSMQAAARRTARQLDDTAHESGRSFKESGAEVGSEFMQNVGEQIGSGQANLLDTINGTLGGVVTALPGLGMIAALGAGVASLIAGGIAGAMSANKAKLQQAINDMLGLLEEGQGLVDRTAVINKAIEDLGGGDRAKGLAEAQRLMAQTGLDAATLGAILAGEVNPSASTVDDTLASIVARAQDAQRAAGGQDTAYTEAGTAAQALLDLINRQNGALGVANGLYSTQLALTDQVRRNAAETNRLFELAYGWGSKAQQLGMPPYTYPTARP